MLRTKIVWLVLSPESTLRPEHPDVAATLENRALLLRRMHRLPEANRLEERARAILAQASASDR